MAYLFQKIATRIEARNACRITGNTEWFAKHTEELERIAREELPSGSGIDNGTTIDLEASTADKIVLHTGFHHMGEHGMYDGWSEHRIVVRASLTGLIDLTIGGRDRNQIKDYLHDMFHHYLTNKVAGL